MSTLTTTTRERTSADASSQQDAQNERTIVRRLTYRRGPASLVGGLIGIVTLVIGIVALARTGIPADDLTAVTATVGPFTRTALMGIIEVLLGLFFLGAGVDEDASGLSFLGLLSLVFGIVWLIEPGAFHDALGIGRGTAWMYTGIGALSLGASAFGPRIERTIRA